MPETPTAEQLLALMPYAAELGIALDEVTPARCVGHLAWAPERCTAGGVMHGGVLMSLADTVGAVCAFLNLPAGATTATTDSQTRLFRAVRDGVVRASSAPVQVGRTLIVVQTDITDADDRLVARTSQAQAVLAG